MMVALYLSMGLQILQCTGWSSAHICILWWPVVLVISLLVQQVVGTEVRKLRRKCHITSNFH